MAFAALIAGGMITIGGNVASAQNILKKCQRPGKVMLQKRASAGVELVPQTVEDYTWNGADWMLSSKSYIKYDGILPVQKISDIYNDGSVMFSERESDTYDADGRLIETIYESSEDNGSVWNKDMRRLTDYDAVRKDVPVLNEIYFWDNSLGEWCLDEENEDGMYRQIERDAEGSVVKSTLWLNSSMLTPLVSQEFKYDITQQPGRVDGAIGMTWKGLDENYELVPQYIYEDMVWQQSDKQYVSIIPSIYYPFDNDPENKLVGYSIYNAAPDGTKGSLDASYKSAYDDKGRLYYVEINFGDGGQYQCVYKLDQDANGSFEYNEILSGDFDESGSIDFPQEYIMNTTVVTRNEHGDIIKEEMYDVDATLQKVLREGYGYDMVYNEEGALAEMTLTYYTDMVDGGSWENFKKTVYSDFTDGTATGIKSAGKVGAGVSLRNNTLYFSNARGAHYIVTDMSGKTCARGIVSADEVNVGSLPDGMYIVKIMGSNCDNAVKLIKK